MLDIILLNIIRLPWIQSRDQALYFLRVAGMASAGFWVFAIIGFELFWFSQFSAQSDQEVWWLLALAGGYFALFFIVSFIQAKAYIGIGGYHYKNLQSNIPMQLMIYALYVIALAVCGIANYGDINPSYIMLCFIPIAVLSQALWWPIAYPLIITANIVAALFFENTTLISAFYLILQQVVLMVMVRAQINEQESKHDLARKNDELHATQSLLGEASRQNERLRIARNIHDIVGHHITALSINLETLKHKTKGDIQQDIANIQDIAKDLLGQVRNAVSEYRMDISLPVEEMLQELTSHAPNLNIELDVEPNLYIKNAELAECLLRSSQEFITNTLRHSRAQNLFLQVQRVNDQIRLTAIDDGVGIDQNINTSGNGLSGMKERVAQQNGTIEIQSEYELGFKAIINLPFHGDAL